jgi:hypothetical protein
MAIKCALCKAEIQNYRKQFHHFEIDQARSADICSECIHKLLKWQQEHYATLFPTRTAKRFLKKDEQQ